MNALKIICALFPALSLSLLSLNLSPVLPISNVSSSRVFHSCARPGSCLCFKIEASLWQNPYGSWEISNHLLSNLLNFWQPHMLPHFFFFGEGGHVCLNSRRCLKQPPTVDHHQLRVLQSLAVLSRQKLFSFCDTAQIYQGDVFSPHKQDADAVFSSDLGQDLTNITFNRVGGKRTLVFRTKTVTDLLFLLIPRKIIQNFNSLCIFYLLLFTHFHLRPDFSFFSHPLRMPRMSVLCKRAGAFQLFCIEFSHVMWSKTFRTFPDLENCFSVNKNINMHLTARRVSISSSLTRAPHSECVSPWLQGWRTWHPGFSHDTRSNLCS